MKKQNIILFVFLIFSNFVKSQNDLFSLIKSDKKSIFTSYTFKGTKIVNGQSVELPAKEVLQFMFQHRFGPLNSGSYNLFGLDFAQVRFSLEYGLKEWMSVGVGRSSYSKNIDANIKIRYKRQVKGEKYFPVTILTNSAIFLKQSNQKEDYLLTNQLVFVNQFLIAKKINRSFSFQFSPTFVHYNLIDENSYLNNFNNHDHFSLGLGGRYKITNRVSINFENFIQLEKSANRNVLAFGFDIETGGHVFQLHLSNSPSMIEPIFIHNTNGDIFNGDIFFGFNISRVFSLNAKN